MVLWSGRCTNHVKWLLFCEMIRSLFYFLSIHAIPIGYPCILVFMVLRRNGVVREDIMTTSMHLEYTIHMCGVDVANQ
jgi:hypothetical protein